MPLTALCVLLSFREICIFGLSSPHPPKWTRAVWKRRVRVLNSTELRFNHCLSSSDQTQSLSVRFSVSEKASVTSCPCQLGSLKIRLCLAFCPTIFLTKFFQFTLTCSHSPDITMASRTHGETNTMCLFTVGATALFYHLRHPHVTSVLWVPTELSLDQEVHRACMVAVVLQHKFFPRQGKEVCKRMGQVLLPIIHGKCGPVHDLGEIFWAHTEPCCLTIAIEMLVWVRKTCPKCSLRWCGSKIKYLPKQKPTGKCKSRPPKIRVRSRTSFEPHPFQQAKAHRGRYRS